MAELVYFQTKELPDLMVAGKSIAVDMSKEVPAFGDFWAQCMKDGIFDRLNGMGDYVYDPDYVGFLTDFHGDQGMAFTYCCGLLMKRGTPVPPGFDSFEIPSCTVGIGWVKGKSLEEILPEAHQLTQAALERKGFKAEDPKWMMELYNDSRYLQPDRDGTVIVDYYIPCRPDL